LAKWRKSTTQKITALGLFFGGPFRFSFSPVANKIKSSASHHTKRDFVENIAPSSLPDFEEKNF
jgi:hypothetical protein